MEQTKLDNIELLIKTVKADYPDADEHLIKVLFVTGFINGYMVERSERLDSIIEHLQNSVIQPCGETIQ